MNEGEQQESSWFDKVKAFLGHYWKKFRLTKWLIFLVLLIIFIFESYLVVGAKMTNVDDLQARLQMTTEIYDQSDQAVGEMADGRGTYVSLNQISPNIQNAVISTEDKRFYQHPGFDIIGIGRAMVGYVVHRGNVVGGGSTLTQQLVKNSFLTNEQSLLRKFKELFIALEVEKKYSKDQILEMYLNHTYFGNGVYGVEDASLKYFGTHAADLNLPNAAVLAGALKGPSLYNPIDNYEEAQGRRNLVLSLMSNNDFISETEAQNAQGTVMPQMNNPVASDQSKYPYYFDSVLEEAINKFGLTEEEVMNGGYKIYTNLNPTYQSQLEAAYENKQLFPTNNSGQASQSATVALDPYNGGVLASVGGVGDYHFRGFNRSTQMKRQPGSTLKPLNVYVPALEHGFSKNDQVPDEVRSYGTDNYRPENWNHQSNGDLPLWEALALSKNTSAVWLMDQVGVNTAMKKLDAFGIPYTDKDLSLASALGGLTEGVSPIQLASAYTAFPNNGKRSEAYFIRKIIGPNGEEVGKEQSPKQNTVMSQGVAKEMTSMMLAVYDGNYTGSQAEPPGYQVAGKTGTVELTLDDPHAAGYNDEWFVAYTPDVVVTSWFGFDQTSSENYISAYSGVNSHSSFNTILQGILANSPGTPFQVESAAKQYGNRFEYNNGEGASQSPHSNSDNEDVINRIIDGGRNLFDYFRGLL
ncbi:transglycosylase domain-containing protein [Aerococcus tenax]|uniref:transglycosylase domain-containing protein n=1 Tax=Aerococcus tenax TaxID=3078812 RepID=UPI0018A718C8|nr:PBP1A family penicillin-binding protein [Aerococcus tenax]